MPFGGGAHATTWLLYSSKREIDHTDSSDNNKDLGLEHLQVY